MKVKEFLEQDEIKKLIANDDLDAVYKNYDQNYGPGYEISDYLLDREINPVDYFKESIPDYALHGCKKLKSITALDGVTNIGTCAFKGCRNLMSADIPNSVTTINAGAFFNCSQLESIALPNSLISIGAYLFEGCSKLTDLHYKGTKERWEKIDKRQSWWHGSFIKVIHCVDGDISI